MADVQDTSGSLSTDAPNPYADMSSDEYAAQFDNDPGKPKPKGEHPVQTFWDKLLHGVKGQDDTTMGRTGEMIRGMAHGVAQAGMETVKTIGEGAAYVDRKTGLGEAIQPGFNDTYDAVGAKGVVAQSTDEGQQTVDHYLGRRTDDPLAAFTESATQFMAGWAATGELKGLAALKGTIKTAAGLARGAAVDATMFDPYQAQLAELAAKAPTSVRNPLLQLMGQGLSATGKALSVNGDDSAIVARLKRAAAGLIPAATIEGLIAASRVVRAGKSLAKGATPEALTEVADHASTVDAAAAGELHPEGMDFVVNPQTLKIDPVLPKTTANGMELPAISLQSPTFADPVEAAQQTESINSALNARKTAGQVDEAAVSQTTDNVVKAVESPTVENISAVSDSPHPGFSYQTAPQDAETIAQTLADKWEKATQHLVDSQGEVHVDQALKLALNGLGEVPQSMAHPVVMALQGQGLGQSIRKLATDYTMKVYSDAINSLTEVVTARPHDPVAVEELRTAMNNYFELRERFTSSNGDAARALRFGQERPKLNGSDVKFASESGASTGLPVPEQAPPKVKAAVEETKNVGETIRGAMKDAEDAIAGVRKNKTDTNAVTAADFSLAKARKAVEAAREKIAKGDISFEHDPELAKSRAEDVKTAADAQRADPQTLSPEEQAAAKATKTTTSNPIEELSKLLDEQETRLDRELEKAGQPARPSKPKQTTPIDDLKAKTKDDGLIEPNLYREPKPKVDAGPIEKTPEGTDLSTPGGNDALPGPAADTNPLGLERSDDLQAELDKVLETVKPGNNPIGTELVNGKEVPVSAVKNAGKDTAKMGPVYGSLNLNGKSVEEVKALGRIFKMSGGEPRNAEAITAAAQVIQKGGFWRKAFEVFANGLLSGPATVQTVLSSAGVLTNFEPITRVFAGALSANGGLVREGADMIAGAWKYAGENLKVAAAALRDGRSVIDPAPQTIAIGGTTGKIVRLPGSIAGAAHEMAKVTNYRAWIYAKSLREGRASGLDGTALASYVENNLRAAFSKDGVAVVPDGLKYGQLTSLSTPLKEGTWGSSLQDFTRNALAAKFIAPFVKISTNVINYTWQSAPGLNLLNAQAREIMSKGGEEAAILHARSALAGSLGLYAYGQASQGNLTGRGPSDPQLRSLWLKDNQPYSFRVNKDSPWHSYQRFEPLAKTIGLMADFHTIRTEMQDDDPSVQHLGYAALASLSNNLASSTYMKGIMDFASTWGSDNPQQVGKYMQNMAVNFTPFGTLMGKANPDPIYREVRSLHDAFLSRVPGYSETLDPRYQWDGAPILKTPGVWNRMSVSPTKPHSDSPVESELLRMNQALVPFPQKFDGIDLSDRTAYDNGTGKSPYSRLMDLINNPQGGGPNLRDDMTNMVKSDDYKGLSDAAYDMSGGPKMEALRKLKTKHELEALSQLREEYPKLDNAITGVTAMKRQNKIGGGDDAVQAIEQEFGTRRPFRGNNFSKH